MGAPFYRHTTSFCVPSTYRFFRKFFFLSPFNMVEADSPLILQRARTQKVLWCQIFKNKVLWRICIYCTYVTRIYFYGCQIWCLFPVLCLLIHVRVVCKINQTSGPKMRHYFRDYIFSLSPASVAVTSKLKQLL